MQSFAGSDAFKLHKLGKNRMTHECLTQSTHTARKALSWLNLRNEMSAYVQRNYMKVVF